MSDLIRREDAIKVTWQEPTYADPLNILTEVRDRIKAIPSADRPFRADEILAQIDRELSIDIVRCKECKHRKPSGCVGSIKTYECDITGFRMHDLTNHFCSYGQKGDENVETD